METAVQQEKRISEHWEVTPSGGIRYTEDDVIDAYLMGKKDGLAGRQRVLAKAFRENVDRCGEYTEKILRYLEDKGFSPENAYLRIGGFDLFNVIICVPRSEFWSDEFLETYDYVGEIEDEIEASESPFFGEFSFMGFHDGYNTKAMVSDGYTLKYRREHEA